MKSIDKADNWLSEKKLNRYGDAEDTMYMGGSPLFNEMTGESTDRYVHLKTKFPDLPWEESTSKKKDPKNDKIKQLILFIGNACINIMWLRVYLLFFHHGLTMDEQTCTTSLRPRVIQALAVSSIELFNAIVGLTKSNPLHVLLFASVRTGVELIAVPQLSCNALPHLITTLCWALDGIRFGCFALDALISFLGCASVPFIKSIRYTVGPLIFPLGAGGEMSMVLCIAMQTGNLLVYFAASLWPLGFYPLMKTLLKQRKRHFQRLKDERRGNNAAKKDM